MAVASGSNLGLFALVWTAATLSLTPVIRRDPRSWIAAAGALLLTVPLADSPSSLAFALFWTALTMTVLLPRAAGFDHAGHWALRLAIHGITSVVGPCRDLLGLRGRAGRGMQVQRIFPLLPPPLVGGAVFLALFDNACQASAYRIEIEVHPRTDHFEIAVTDNGRGIAPADAGRVFEPFFTTRRAAGGTGLGLAISVSLLGAGGGRLSLDRSVESGSRFCVVLPFAHAAT